MDVYLYCVHRYYLKYIYIYFLIIIITRPLTDLLSGGVIPLSVSFSCMYYIQQYPLGSLPIRFFMYDLTYSNFSAIFIHTAYIELGMKTVNQ